MESTRLKALQFAAAYYVLYHTQLIWSISNSPEDGVGGPARSSVLTFSSKYTTINGMETVCSNTFSASIKKAAQSL
jgi:hypothetical protein